MNPTLQPIIDTLIPLLPGWLELPESYVGLLKGASHKYVRRVPKAGGGYRYFYHVGHGGGINNEDHFVPGASFRFEGGHYHIKSAEGGKLVIEHDETKERKTVSKSELRHMLGAHHEPAIKAHREKVAGMLAEARANKASPKQIAKLEARAKAVGASTDAPVPQSKNPLLQPGAVIRPRKDAYMGQQEMIVTGMDGGDLLVEFPHPDGGVIKRGMPASLIERHYEIVHAAKASADNTEDHHARIARLGLEAPSEKRAETLAMAHSVGVDDQTFKRLADANRVNRADFIVLPPHRYEELSRGRGWARRGKGSSAEWGTKTDSGYRVTPGRWTIGGNDGFSRKGEVEWDVSHVQVGPHTWTVAD